MERRSVAPYLSCGYILQADQSRSRSEIHGFEHTGRRRHHRRRPRRIRRRDPRRPARPHHRLRRDGQDARRHLRQRRLHSVQGAARRRPSTIEFAPARRGDARHRRRRRDARSRDDAQAEGRRRRRRTRKGIEFLFRKNKITWAKGRGTLRAGQRRRRRRGARRAPREHRPTRRRTSSSPPAPCRSSCPSSSSTRSASSRTSARSRFPKSRSTSSSSAAASSASSSAPSGADSARRSPSSSCMPTILPGMDDEVVKEADTRLPQAGARHPHRHEGHRAAARTDDGVFVEVEKDGKTETLEGDYVLVSVGRRPSLDRHRRRRRSASTLGKRGEILVDDQMRTNLPNVYAIGDCVGGPDARAQGRGRGRRSRPR